MPVAAQLAAMALSVSFIGWILATRADYFRQAFSLDAKTFTLISLSALATFAVNGLELWVLASSFGSSIPFRDTALLGLMVTTLNYLPMKAGTVLNGLIMRARHRVHLADFAALVAGSTVIHLWVSAVLAGVFLLVEGRERGLAFALLLVPTGVMAGLVAWGRARRHVGRGEPRTSLARALTRAVGGVGTIFGSPGLLVVEILINLTLVMLAGARMALAFRALSLDVPFGSAVVATALSIMAARLSVIPGGLGFKEGGAALGASSVGVAAAMGLAASVIDRAVTLVWLVPLGIPATYHLLRATGVHLSLSGRVVPTEGGGSS